MFHTPSSPQHFEALYTLYIHKVYQTILPVTNDFSGMDDQEISQKTDKGLNP